MNKYQTEIAAALDAREKLVVEHTHHLEALDNCIKRNREAAHKLSIALHMTEKVYGDSAELFTYSLITKGVLNRFEPNDFMYTTDPALSSSPNNITITFECAVKWSEDAVKIHINAHQPTTNDGCSGEIYADGLFVVTLVTIVGGPPAMEQASIVCHLLDALDASSMRKPILDFLGENLSSIK